MVVEAELERFTRGDMQAFEALFREYEGEVYGWIIRIVHDSGAAEDLTIETFWRIYRARVRFDPCRSFGPWARRIATWRGRRTMVFPYAFRALERQTLPLQPTSAQRCWLPWMNCPPNSGSRSGWP